MRGVFQKPYKGPAWWIRWTCPYGHRHEERIGPKAQAILMAERRRVAVKTDGFCLTVQRSAANRCTPLLLRDAVSAYLSWATLHRPRSLAFRQAALTPLVAAQGASSCNDLTATHIEAYLQSRRDAGAAAGTVNRDRAVISHLLTRLVRQGVLTDNQAAKTERRPETGNPPRPLLPDEEARLFTILPTTYHAVVTIAIHTGLRLGELKSQTWRDIDLEAGILTVTRPKSGQSESLPLNGTARRILLSLERTGPLVFPGLPADMSRRFTKYATEAKLTDLTFHCLRDTFISRLAQHVSTPVLMALARHRDYRTTRRYVKIDGQHLRQAVERIADQSSISMGKSGRGEGKSGTDGTGVLGGAITG